MEKLEWSLVPDLELAHVIHQTNNYAVVITPIDWILKGMEIGRDLGCYCIMNKIYSTIESTANNLPIVYTACDTLEEHLRLAFDKIKAKETKDAINIVSLRQDSPKQL